MVAIIGRSNVGKSTLVNALVGEKIAIVTPKPQTTRDLIHGVYNDARGQIVFIDTPGFFLDAHDLLSKKLLDRVAFSMKDVNCIVYMVDPTRPVGNEERRLASLLRAAQPPKILVLNKMDIPERQRPYQTDYPELFPEAEKMIEISARTRTHLKTLLNDLFERMPEGAPLYPPETQLRNDRHYIAEVIREKIFHTMADELPYGVYVRVEAIEHKPHIVVIAATIVTHTQRHKKMIIGHGARALKEMGTSARKELELWAQKKIFLDLHVKVDPRWMEELT